MIHSDLDALLQGALDNTLTPEERDRLARLISESQEARARAAEFEQLTGLIESLGPANPPPGLVERVLARVSQRPYAVRPSTFERGVTVNKKILFGLAAAAAIVLAVFAYKSYPRPIEGTEATIGAAQRAQTPQIAAQDVKLGDTSTQNILQTETFDAIMKDDAVRTMLQSAEMRIFLQSEALRDSLKQDAIIRAISDPGMVRWLNDPAFVSALNNPEMAHRFNDTNVRILLTNRVFADAMRKAEFRNLLLRTSVRAGLTSAAFQSALLDRGFDAAVRSPEFAAQLAGRQLHQ
jgi:hypothetical protein